MNQTFSCLAVFGALSPEDAATDLMIGSILESLVAIVLDNGDVPQP